MCQSVLNILYISYNLYDFREADDDIKYPNIYL